MSKHPYENAAPSRLWRRAVAAPALPDIDPAIDFPFRIAAEHRIVTAGSCFAQHIARHLGARGFNHFITEPAHPLLDAATAREFNYGIYAARYGNIYTARQLLQLFRRAHGLFTPDEHIWQESGRYVDPFRPMIQPDGFASAREFELDQAQHFAAVRRACAELDVFVFTLGLTECWESTRDGAVYPLCPGTARGTFDPARHRLRNLTVDEIVWDLRKFIELLRGVNPAARIVLTVSPVPLVATALPRHVLTATTYSKSVLRVAADVVARGDGVAYFPAYEIITGAHARGHYFADDLRSVTEAGVEHVMRCFFRHAGAAIQPDVANRPADDDGFAAMKSVVEAICEEESLDR
jgi:hypothetical protein